MKWSLTVAMEWLSCVPRESNCKTSRSASARMMSDVAWPPELPPELRRLFQEEAHALLAGRDRAAASIELSARCCAFIRRAHARIVASAGLSLMPAVYAI